MMNRFMTVALGLTLIFPDVGNATEPTELNGTWVEQISVPTREEHPGKALPRGTPHTLVIDGRQLTWKEGDRLVRQSLGRVMPNSSPKALDLMTVVGDEFWLSPAIYRVESDTLTLCEGVRDQPRPTEFRRWRGELDQKLTLLTTYKRQATPNQLAVGQVAPKVDGLAPDDSPLDPKAWAGKYVLLNFWRTDDAALARHFTKLREVRREFMTAEKLLIVSMRIDNTAFSDWLNFLNRQLPLDPEFPRRAFFDDAKWQHFFHASVNQVGSNPYGVGHTPESFLIDPAGKILAVRIPEGDLPRAITKALQTAR